MTIASLLDTPLEGLVWFGALVLAVHRARRVLECPATQRGIDAVAGTAVVGFGLKLGLGH